MLLTEWREYCRSIRANIWVVYREPPLSHELQFREFMAPATAGRRRLTVREDPPEITDFSRFEFVQILSPDDAMTLDVAAMSRIRQEIPKPKVNCGLKPPDIKRSNQCTDNRSSDE